MKIYNNIYFQGIFEPGRDQWINNFKS